MKLITISITLVLVGLGFGAGHYEGYFQGRDEVHTAMMDTMGGMGMGQMNSHR